MQPVIKNRYLLGLLALLVTACSSGDANELDTAGDPDGENAVGADGGLVEDEPLQDSDSGTEGSGEGMAEAGAEVDDGPPDDGMRTQDAGTEERTPTEDDVGIEDAGTADDEGTEAREAGPSTATPPEDYPVVGPCFDDSSGPDQRTRQSATYSYDENDQVLVETRDHDDDGTPDYQVRHTYDDAGNTLTSEWDDGADGTIDGIFANDYDEDGQLLSETTDHGADGSIEFRTSYSYDADGNLISESVDREGDGVIDRVWTATYDEDGHLLSEESDSDGNGTINWRNTYSYDANGMLLTEEAHRDSNGDGMIDTFDRLVYTYDEDGNLVTQENYDPTGALVTVVKVTYDENGELLTRTVDTDGDGAIDLRTAYVYDDSGNVLSEARTGSNGTVDTTTYTYDENGNVLSVQIKDQDGDLSFLSTNVYDDHGRLVTTETDGDGDGFTDLHASYAYDENGALRSELSLHGYPATASTEYTYDERGNLLMVRQCWPSP